MPNDSPTTQTEFVLRRLTEGFNLFGLELHSYIWLAVLGVVLGFGIFYVVWMYRKDRASIPLGFAILLALARITIYLLLGLVFLLPAVQHWEKVEKRSRVVVLLDVSPSMFVSDEIPSAAKPANQLESRMDKVLKFLSDKDVDFLARLMTKNPVVVYRFGSRLDEEFTTFDGKPWTPEDWTAWVKVDPKKWLVQGLSEAGRKVVLDHPEFEGDKPGSVEWAVKWLKKDDTEVLPPAAIEGVGFTPDDRKKLEENRKKLEKRLEVTRQLLQGTNVGESALAALNREGTNMLQGLVVISDGRSNLGSESMLKDVRDLAKRQNVPVFTVVVGEDRQAVNIQIVDVQTPEQAPPDERFVVRAEVDGVGLAGKEKPVFLDVYKPGDDPKKAKPIHTVPAKLTFAPGEPPHAQIEFPIDPTADGPDKLPLDFFKPIRKPDAAPKPDEPKPGTPPAAKPPAEQFSTGKPELLEGEWKFTVRVPRDENEAFVGKEHVSDVVSVQVIKKPLRVLLFAGGAERDFQFVRTMLVREKDQKRCELSVFVQNLGRDGRDVQDVEPERRLNRFPTNLLVGEAAASIDPKEKYYNLDQYDVIIAFDPDWAELEAQQIRLLKTWVERQAGGLIIVGGPIHTFQLARAVEGDKLQALAELFPVVPGDSVLPVNPNAGLRRNTKKAWWLNFPGANKDMEFLKLDDDKAAPLAGWDEFFFKKDKRDGRETEALRGFYTFYPVQSVKKGATVVATFSDPAARFQDGTEHPFLVTMDYPQGKIVFIGGEMWRLRGYKDVFYERFWIKLARYASAGTRVRQNKRGVLVYSKQSAAGNFFRFEAQMFGPDSNPLPENAEVKAFIAPLQSDDPKERKEVKLTAKRSAVQWGGWFQGRYLVNSPGEYKVEVPIPGSPDALRGKFLVKESNPELDMVRPDFAAMYRLAGDFAEIQSRPLDKAVFDKVRVALVGRKPATEKPPETKPEPKPPTEPVSTTDAPTDGPRLAFDLKSAGMIPDLMTTQTKVQRNRGPVDDLWDDGPTLGHDKRGLPIMVPWLLMAVVGLFSFEWLTRKLLRLA